MTYLDLKIGNIHLTDRLGTGGMGTVYVGFDEKLQRKVAVKAIRGDRVDAETRARLLREARLLSQLDHPNICRIHDYIEGDISDYLILELVPGKSLDEALESGIDLAVKLRVAEQVAQALAAAHARGIIHRDLKPTNIMLSPKGQAKVLDFGLARSLEPQQGEWTTGKYSPIDPTAVEAAEPGSRLDTWREGQTPVGARMGRLSASINTEPGHVLGTASFMSPEQARGERVTVASDIYSLSLVLQVLFTERPPYEPGLAPELVLVKATDGDALPVTGLPTELASLIDGMRSVAPLSRPAATEVVDRLQRIRSRPKRRLKRFFSVAALVALVLTGFAYTLHLRQQRDLAVTARIEAESARLAAEQSLADRALLLEEMVTVREQALGSEHVDVASSHHEAALIYELIGDEPRARHHYRRALRILLTLRRMDDARPIAEKILDKEWGDPELWAFCREQGLVLESPAESPG